MKTVSEIMARGLGKKGTGRRASQRINVEIEIYALEGGGGEELLAGGKEEAAETVLECIVNDYLTFIVLLFGLFCVSGNINLDDDVIGVVKLRL